MLVKLAGVLRIPYFELKCIARILYIKNKEFQNFWNLTELRSAFVIELNLAMNEILKFSQWKKITKSSFETSVIYQELRLYFLKFIINSEEFAVTHPPAATAKELL